MQKRAVSKTMRRDRSAKRQLHSQGYYNKWNGYIQTSLTSVFSDACTTCLQKCLSTFPSISWDSPAIIKFLISIPDCRLVPTELRQLTELILRGYLKLQMDTEFLAVASRLLSLDLNMPRIPQSEVRFPNSPHSQKNYSFRVRGIICVHFQDSSSSCSALTIDLAFVVKDQAMFVVVVEDQGSMVVRFGRATRCTLETIFKPPSQPKLGPLTVFYIIQVGRTTKAS